MLYGEIIGFFFSHPHKTNTLCGQNGEFFNVKTGSTYSNHRFVDTCRRNLLSPFSVYGSVGGFLKRRYVSTK